MNASMPDDFANSRGYPRLLSLIAAFIAVDCLRIDDDNEGSVASRRVIWPDLQPFNNHVVRRAPFKKFNVRREFLMEHKLDPFGLTRHSDPLKNISESLSVVPILDDPRRSRDAHERPFAADAANSCRPWIDA